MATRKSKEKPKETADKKQKTDEENAVAKPVKPAPPQKSLYDKEIDRYRLYLQRGFDTAFKYYGFTMFHSLSSEEKIELFKKLGFEPKNPEDFYNLGCLAASNENFKEARDFFQKTIEMAADFEEAYYNLALAQERLGEDQKAIDNWELYSEFLDEDSSESILVADHISELRESVKGGKKK